MSTTTLPLESDGYRAEGARNVLDALQPNSSIVRRIVKLGLFVGIQLVLFVVLLEIVGRVADPLGISYYPDTARYLDTMIKEEPIGYRNRPGLKGRYHGATYTINSIGLRNEEIPAKEPNEFRILMLGDSVVFGLGVEDSETIPRVVERLANEQAGGRKIRVINMGVPSYNSEQELVQLQSLGLSLEPDAVVLLYTLNDIETKMWVFERRESKLVDLAQRSYAACLLFTLRRQLMTAFGREPSLVSTGDYHHDHPRWQAVDQSLTQLNHICEQRDIPFLLLVGGDQDTKPYSLHFELADREGFPIATLDPWTDDRWKDLDRSKHLNSATDLHCNEDGCEIYGTKVWELMLEAGVIAFDRSIALTEPEGLQ